MSSCSRRHRPPDCQPSAWISTRRSFVRRSFTAGLLCGWRRGDGVQPWVLLQPDQEVRTELDRWFLTVAGSVDAITAGVLLALARRLRRTLLVLELAGAVIVAGAIILPFQPTFAAILAIGVVPLIAYQYWRDVRMLHMPRLAGICRPNGPALD
jgi:hypothetical protein